MKIDESLQKLINSLKTLPGIGEKSAQRIAMHLLNKNKEEILDLADLLKFLVSNYKKCSICNRYTESDPCSLCNDQNRNQTLICIVEKTEDIYLIEETQEYKGLYFVLGALLSPIDGIGQNQINFEKLENLLEERSQIKEIILALNPSVEGEVTMVFLADSLKDYQVTRLATGLPFGCDIHYSTTYTLANALKRRFSVHEELPKH